MTSSNANPSSAVACDCSFGAAAAAAAADEEELTPAASAIAFAPPLRAPAAGERAAIGMATVDELGLNSAAAGLSDMALCCAGFASHTHQEVRAPSTCAPSSQGLLRRHADAGMVSTVCSWIRIGRAGARLAGGERGEEIDAFKRAQLFAFGYARLCVVVG